MNLTSFFETIRCQDGDIFHLTYHQKRIARTIGLNINLSDYIYPPSNKLLKCKIIYNKNGILDIKYTQYRPKIITTFKLIYDDNIEYKYKMLNRENLDNLYTKKGLADEIIIVKNGLITDTTIANIAIYNGTFWITPKSPLLFGTTRNRLLNEDKLIEKDITVDELLLAKKIALMNAMIDFKILEKVGFI
jgi:4-amino-4-deoxychorismate lyase